MLLFALCWLTLPTVFAPLERWGLGLVSLVPELAASWRGTPVHAAEPAVAARLQELTFDLEVRTAKHDIGSAARFVPAGWEPVHCAVLSADSRRGGGDQPCELLLDHSYAELAGCSAYVTKADVLLGYLVQPGEALAGEDEPDDPARVILLNHRAAAPVMAETARTSGGALQMIVGPAAVADPAPLRVDLWDNPFTASRLRHGGQLVHVVPLDRVDDQPPPGLWLGRTLVWGYDGEVGQDPLAIGVYVSTPFEPRSLSHVVVWRQRGVSAPQPPLRERSRRIPARLWDLPGAAGRRFLLSASAAVPSGAAVVHAGLCIGTTRGLSFGNALVTSFLGSRRRWNLILLPSAAGERPRELSAEVVETDAGVAVLRCRSDSYDGFHAPLPRGYLFTGSNGRGCPAGLFLGAAEPGYELEELQVTIPIEAGPLDVEVLVPGGER